MNRVSEMLSQLNWHQQNLSSVSGQISVPCNIQSRGPWEGPKVPFPQIKARYGIYWDISIRRGAYGNVVEAVDKQTKRVSAQSVYLEDGKSMLCMHCAEPRNQHFIKVYDFWYQHNIEEDISRTFIKRDRCHGNLKEYLNGMQTRGQNMEPLELTEIMIQ